MRKAHIRESYIPFISFFYPQPFPSHDSNPRHFAPPASSPAHLPPLPPLPETSAYNSTYPSFTSLPPFHPLGRLMNGCLSASNGVQRRSGLRLRQRSSRSIKRCTSLTSASFMPFVAGNKRILRSRTGLVKFSTRTVSYIQKKKKQFRYLSPHFRGKVKAKKEGEIGADIRRRGKPGK